MNNNYISEFQIIGSSIKSLTIKNDYIALPTNNSVKRKIDISHEIQSIENNEESMLLTGIVILNIKVLISHEKKKYRLDMSIEGCFNAPNGIGENTFTDMLNVNGITSLYSIARGFAQSVSAQTLVDGNILLPMLNVVAYSKNINEETEE